MSEKVKAVRDIRAEITARIISDLEAGVAPWQKPWRPDLMMLPHNGVTGRRYRGGNALLLMHAMAEHGYEDHRWMTFKQALAQDASVRKGEKGTQVEYWQFEKRVPKLDDYGNPDIGPDGKPLYEVVKTGAPRVFYATVFNAAQIDGLKPVEKNDLVIKWDPVADAERIIEESGAAILHDQADRACYRPSSDSIHMPARAQFADAGAYYGTMIHELGHWTGHESRLARDLSGGFGSESYAREELRAELASFFMAAEFGIPHDPGQHSAYIGSWLDALKKDKHEIFRAAAEADKIVAFLSAFSHDMKLNPSAVPEEEDEVFGIPQP